MGDADANVIDFRASYAATSINSRMINGLNYLNKDYAYNEENIAAENFVISNVKDGEMVGLYTNIAADHAIAIADMVDFYKVDGIGNTSNLEYHVFQIYGEGAPETNIVEWLGMDHGKYGVMVPYYPMLTTDTYAGYQVGTAKASFVTEKPENVPSYPATQRDGTEGFKALPENWADSYYWSFDALSNYILSVDNSSEQKVLDTMATLQAEIYASFADMKAEAEDAGDLSALAASMTEASMNLAQQAHETAVTLYNEISAN